MAESYQLKVLKIIGIAFLIVIINFKANAELPRKVAASKEKSLINLAPKALQAKQIKKIRFDNNIKDVRKLPGASRLDVSHVNKKVQIISGKSRKESPSSPTPSGGVSAEIEKESKDFSARIENKNTAN